MSRFKEEKFKKQLRVVLDDSEKDEIRERLVNVLDEVEEIQKVKTQKMSEFDKDIKAKNGQVTSLRKDIKFGALQDVDCIRKFDFHEGTVNEYRGDTGELLGSRKVTDADRQQYLPGDDLK